MSMAITVDRVAGKKGPERPAVKQRSKGVQA